MSVKLTFLRDTRSQRVGCDQVGSLLGITLFVGAADDAHEQRRGNSRQQDVRQHDAGRKRAGRDEHHQKPPVVCFFTMLWR